MTAAKTNPVASTADREIVTTRVFDAPRELVFKAWTDPKVIGEWFGPNGFTITTHQMEVRPGGCWRFIMHGPDGVDYPNLIVYVEVVHPERLVYDQSGGVDGDDNHFRTTVTFVEADGKTTLTLRAVFGSAEEREKVVREYGAIEGAQQTMARLADLLRKLQR